MSEIRNLIRRMWWRGIGVDVIASSLAISVADVESFLFTRMGGHHHSAAGSTQ